MPHHNKRNDITVEMVGEEYEKCSNMSIVAENLDCSIFLVRSRLQKLGVEIVNNNNNRRVLKAEPTERKVFDSKQEQAHYICTELSEPLAELLCEIRG